MTTVINLYGGPGSAKSTTAAGLFYKMKLAGYKVELVTEYAKDLVYADQLESMLENQEFIFAQQNWRIQRLLGKVDWVITDSPINLSAVYPKINRKLNNTNHWPAEKEFVNFVHAQFKSYNNILYYIERPDTFEEYGRHHNFKQSQYIDSVILQMLDEHYEYTRIKADEHTIDNLLEYINA